MKRLLLWRQEQRRKMFAMHGVVDEEHHQGGKRQSNEVKQPPEPLPACLPRIVKDWLPHELSNVHRKARGKQGQTKRSARVQIVKGSRPHPQTAILPLCANSCAKISASFCGRRSPLSYSDLPSFLVFLR